MYNFIDIFIIKLVSYYKYNYTYIFMICDVFELMSYYLSNFESWMVNANYHKVSSLYSQKVLWKAVRCNLVICSSLLNSWKADKVMQILCMWTNI